MRAPQPDEYNAYYAHYVARAVESGDVLTTLEAQGREALAMCEALTEERAGYAYAPDKWTIRQLLGHLVDCERVFATRAMAIARGETQPLWGLDQDDYVREGRFDERSVASLSAEWQGLRAATLALFASFDDERWDRRGTASGSEVTVRALAFIIAGHERHHLDVLRERYA